MERRTNFSVCIKKFFWCKMACFFKPLHLLSRRLWVCLNTSKRFPLKNHNFPPFFKLPYLGPRHPEITHLNQPRLPYHIQPQQAMSRLTIPRLPCLTPTNLTLPCNARPNHACLERTLPRLSKTRLTEPTVPCLPDRTSPFRTLPNRASPATTEHAMPWLATLDLTGTRLTCLTVPRLTLTIRN